jgi:hypothetical protein
MLANKGRLPSLKFDAAEAKDLALALASTGKNGKNCLKTLQNKGLLPKNS